MTAHALPYGAIELKRVAQRNWRFGFALSLLVHFCMLGLYLLTGPYDSGQLRLPVRPHGTIEILLGDGPEVNAGIASHSREPAVKRIDMTKAIPEPVKEQPPARPPEKSQETAQQGSERGIGVGEPGTEKGDEGTGIVDEGEHLPFTIVEKPPVVIASDIPEYPAMALRAGLEGKVWVNILVDNKGKAKKAVVYQSTNDIFNEPALASARKFVFTPAYMSSGPVAVWVVVPFAFKLH